ncbi:putative arabinosyltransferase [Gordonia hirsuta DSM 44140 = NBRC 16056]|uniref:Putative arabinosyltransferase n=1 Tax=Gordonia hirsuta DSM 44140 = NBRC 16056 TaxID=1121927 RepID=L7LDC1_9ACTN|nr:arabinosyltransferase domain-containing protein [Gordonia hirsuta]GAC58023.1 putative arabinosyltransferase [Gordonia hirsuta DSM 44140 = NBRC 16056]
MTDRPDHSPGGSAPADAPATAPATPVSSSRWAFATRDGYRVTKLAATVFGLLGLLLALATPLLPVEQRSATLNWPQNDVISDVTAPLVAFVPTSMEMTVPCSLAAELPATGGVLVSTIPQTGKQAGARGMFVRATESDLAVTVRDVVLLSVPRAAAQSDPDCMIELRGDGEGVSAAVVGAGADGTGPNPTNGDETRYSSDDPDMRPQIVGVFSDLPAQTDRAGLYLTADIDTRFVNRPSPLKRALIIIGIVSTLLSLIALAVLDSRDGRVHKRFLPRGWFTIRGPDVVVFAVLALWWLIGGNTSDDGYNITVARITEEAGYADNYFRYFGVPQDPFGWPYQVLSWMTSISVATPWLRLPAFLLGLLGWWILSREVIPRLGRSVRNSSAAVWSGALVFLAIWLPYNNGIRFEPVEAIGALLTWCAVERAIATRRLLPYAVAAVFGAFTFAVAPGGLMAVAALLAGLRPVVRGIVSRRSRDGLLPMIAPVLAAGTSVLFLIFYSHPLRPLIEGSGVASDVGPTNEWWQEPQRYYFLILQTGDGTFSRRFGILIMFTALVIAIFRLLAKHSPAGVARAPLWRLIAVMLGTMFFISFTPTKWTHHLGIYAGIGAAIVAATAAMMSPALLRARSNRAFFAAIILMVTAAAASGTNMWWYVGSYGVPWWDAPVSLGGIKLAWVLLALAVITALYGFWCYLRSDDVDPPPGTGYTRTGLARFTFSPLPVISAFVVAFMLFSFVFGAYKQRDSWSWAKSNLRALTGNECALANDVLVEDDIAASFLDPAAVDGRPAPTPRAALGAQNDGFVADGIPSTTLIDPVDRRTGNTTDEDSVQTSVPSGELPVEDTESEDETTVDETAEDQTAPAADAGSVRLPYGLDPATTPVLGSYGTAGNTSVTTAWYDLGFPAGQAPEDAPLLTVAAAGSIAAVDRNNLVTDGRRLVAQFARLDGDTVVPVGEPMLGIDAMDSKSEWRTLRFPLSQAPPRATLVRLHAVDDAAATAEWLAFTAPRVPHLRTLEEVVGRTDPVLIDWLPGLVFPCQRPVAVRNGVLELPDWRIMPDAEAVRVNSQTWQAGIHGGPLGITDALLVSTLVPSYLRNNWSRDWGSLQRYTPLVPQAKPAELELGYRTVSGLQSRAPMRSAGY